MKIVKLVFDGNRTRLLDEVKVDPSCTVDHDGFVWTQDSTFKPFDAVEIEGLYNHDEDFHSDDSVSVVHTKNGTKRYKHIGEEMKDDKTEVPPRPALPPTSTPTAMPPVKPSTDSELRARLQPPAPTFPVAIQLEVQTRLSAEMQCMDLFEQLMVTHYFENMDRSAGWESTLVWMRSALDRKIAKLHPAPVPPK